MKTKFLLLVLLVFSQMAFAKNVSNGLINFEHTIDDDKVLRLSGDWEFYANQTFSALQDAQLKIDFVQVPGSWNKISINQEMHLSPYGSSTYRVLIDGLRVNYPYGIYSRKSPALAARIYANGNFIDEIGKFSRHDDMEYRGTMQPMLERFYSDSDGRIELVIQVANYTQPKGGIVYPILFGEYTEVSALYGNIMVLVADLLGALVFIFLVNAFIWILDRSKNINLYFAILLFTCVCRLGIYDFNMLSLISKGLPYEWAYRLSNLVMVTFGIFAILYKNDSAFLFRHPFMDNAIAGFAGMIGIMFLCLPVRISGYILVALIFVQFAFYAYSLFRMVVGFQHAQKKAALFAMFYCIVSLGVLLDEFFVSPRADTLFTFTEISITLLIAIDVFYLAFILEKLAQNSLKQKELLSDFYTAYRKFVPREILRILKKDNYSEMHIGDSGKDELSIMIIGVGVVSPDNTSISLRETFETLAFYSSKVVDCIQKNGGTVMSINSMGLLSVFQNADNAVKCARDVRNLLQDMNFRRAEDYYPCVAFNISVHNGPVLLGIIGELDRMDFTMLSPAMELADKICHLGFSMNVPVIISEPTVKRLGEDSVQKLKLLGRVKFSEFEQTIGLFGIVSAEEEENSLETVEEVEVITQRDADKYVNF